MYSQLRIFPITAWASGAPTISQSLPFLAVGSAETEINNISLSLAVKASTRTWKADNKEEEDEVKTGYDGTLQIYGIDKDAIAAITPNQKDSSGRTVLMTSVDGSAKVVLFYRGKNAKGKKFNIWLYNCEFKDMPIDNEQEGDTPKSITLTFTASSIVYNSKTIQGIIVWEGDTGYVAESDEPEAADLVLPTFTL